MSHSNYPTAWLDCRYPFDANGRNKSIEKSWIQQLENYRRVHILDLGAGNGSNYKYFSPLITSAQRWTCLEIDPVLVKEIELLGNENVRGVEGSVLEMDQLVDLTDVDVVMANALFDLFPPEYFEKIVAELAKKGIPFLFGMNYKYMSFYPELETDSMVLQWYHRHMQRVQDFGQAMGAEGPLKMLEILNQFKNYRVLMGHSVWKVSPRDTTMLSYLLHFMNRAIPELDLTAEERIIFAKWMDLRILQAREELLSIEVWHEDIAALNN